MSADHEFNIAGNRAARCRARRWDRRFGSGPWIAAITYVIQAIVNVDDNVVSVRQFYGGTYNLFMHALPRQNIEVRLAPRDDIDKFGQMIDDNAKVEFCELIGNPADNVVNVERLAEIAYRHGVSISIQH